MVNKINSQDLDFQVDINEATLAIKENRFFDAFNLLEINISKYPDRVLNN